MSYAIRLTSDSFLTLYERVGDSHFTFGTTPQIDRTTELTATIPWKRQVPTVLEHYRSQGQPFGEVSEVIHWKQSLLI